MKNRVAFIGAHPDDPEVGGGGLALLYRQRGWDVLFVSLTDGCMGHHLEAPDALRIRRASEARRVAKTFGIEYVILDNPDGSLTPGLEQRQALIRVLRGFAPRAVFTHPLVDYHPDHRYTSQLTGDAAFLLRVPHYCPDAAALDFDPVQAFYYPAWRYPELPPGFTVAVSIDEVWSRKVDMMACHESQFFEWLPWLAGVKPEDIPADPLDRRCWLDHDRAPHDRLAANHARARLTKLYGQQRGAGVEHAEVFASAPFPEPLSAANFRDLFPFF